MNHFKLDEKLANDSIFIDKLNLSQLLLMNDSNYIWLILVPQRINKIELIDLDFEDQIELLKEINDISNILKKRFLADKINIATLGNVVKQLHIHIIARKNNDPSFPKPVWNAIPAKKYDQDESRNIISIIKNSLYE